MSGLRQDQVDTLLRPIRPKRVLQAQGQSHVAACDIIAHLSRVFGFGGWSNDIVSLDLIHEHHQGEPPKARAWVTYRCVMRLTIFDPDATWKTKKVYNFTARELQVPVFKGGELVYKLPSLEEIRAYCLAQVDTLWDEVKRFDYSHKYVVDLSRKLWDIQQELLRSSQQ